MKKTKNTKRKQHSEKGKMPKAWNKGIESFLFSDSPSATAAKFLLAFIAIGGVAFVGATAPGLVKVADAFWRAGKNYQKMKKRYPERKITNSLAYLKKKRLIEILEEKNGKVRVRLTNRGRKRLAEYSFDALEIKKPETWDGKWRIVMFDIPASPKAHQYARDALRNKIKKLGFYQVQKSVWVYPYECEDELLFIAEMLKIQQYVEILTVEKLLHEKILRAEFSL